MSEQKRFRGKLGSAGPFLAEVTNHLDLNFMGVLDVALITPVPNSVYSKGDVISVKYLSPFAGSTSVRFEGNNNSDYNDSQKSYGFWMVPPDIGAKVMVIFIDGDSNQGYWFGCVYDFSQNHMVPGIAASKYVSATPEQIRRFGTEYLPVAEYNKKTFVDNPNISTIKKPIHPFAERLLAQGLIQDNVRGVTSSSARREVPSGVFGISTPGPLDRSTNAKRGKVGYSDSNTGLTTIPVSRLGGSTFVMDDGDKNGNNELIRIRTRTGHQILLHNSHDLIYIANSKGTAWVELTSNGKIDIFAQDSVSIHTEVDFNFRADRDINIEAGRNLNLKAYGKAEVNILKDFKLIVGENQYIKVGKNKDETILEQSKLTVLKDSHVNIGQKSYVTSTDDMHISTKNNMYQLSNTDFHVKADGNYKETATRIDMNSTGNAATAATYATTSTVPVLLSTFALPNRKQSYGWADGKFFKAPDIETIMLRVPTHEPWDHHENNDPVKYSSTGTNVG
jgi:hypothetical protein